jgi:transglutaminase-like putative cysteine protease
MGIRVVVHHKTRYRYDRPIHLGPQVVRLRPAPHCRTSILSYSLKVVPKKHFVNWQQDPQGNYQARLVLPEPTRRFELEVDLVAELEAFNPFDFFLEPSAERAPFEYGKNLALQLEPCASSRRARCSSVTSRTWTCGSCPRSTTSSRSTSA